MDNVDKSVYNLFKTVYFVYKPGDKNFLGKSKVRAFPGNPVPPKVGLNQEKFLGLICS